MCIYIYIYFFFKVVWGFFYDVKTVGFLLFDWNDEQMLLAVNICRRWRLKYEQENDELDEEGRWEIDINDVEG